MVEPWQPFCDFWLWLTSKMADNVCKLKIHPNLLVFGVHFKSLSLMVGPLLWFLGVADIKDGQQYDSFNKDGHQRSFLSELEFLVFPSFLSFWSNLTSCGFILTSYDVGSYWLNLIPCKLNLTSFGLNLIQRVTNVKFFSPWYFQFIDLYWPRLCKICLPPFRKGEHKSARHKIEN